MDEANRSSGCGLLQPPGSGGFDSAGSRDGSPRVAVAARRTETEGHPAAAFGIGVPVRCADLAGVVGTFPRTATWECAAKLPDTTRTLRGRRRISDRASRRFSERRKRARLDASRSLRMWARTIWAKPF